MSYTNINRMEFVFRKLFEEMCTGVVIYCATCQIQFMLLLCIRASIVGGSGKIGSVISIWLVAGIVVRT